MRKLIASDYDGTLNRRGIAEKVVKAIDKWQLDGNLFGIVSGRGLMSLLSVIRHDPITCDYLIAANGALIADGEAKVLLCHTVSAEIGKAIAAFVLENGGYHASVNTLSGEVFIVTTERKARHANDPSFRLLSEYDMTEAVYEISTYFDTVEEAFAFVEKLHAAFPKTVSGLINGSCIDIVPYGVNKAKGIEDFCRLYDIDKDNVITVGDNYNDREMLTAYRSYAVENAVDDMKKIANYVVEDIAELCKKESVL